MAEALDPAAYIFEGIWTDWSKGSVLGLTLTFCPTSSTLLTNSLALFVTLAGGQLWTILRFTLHQLRASPPRAQITTPHNQQQVVLRNATTDLATARLMFMVAWASRRGAEKLSSRAVLIGLFAILHASLFMVAGTLSNRLIMGAGSVTDPSLVLSRSQNCGVWNDTYYDIATQGPNPSSDETLDLSVQYIAKFIHNIQLSLEYAQECYLPQSVSSLMSATCNTLKQPNLNWTQHEGTCPFDQGMCHESSPTIVFDTGPVDSHYDLGINARHRDRLSYRRITTCSVLNDTDHIKGWRDPTERATENPKMDTAYAYYGPSTVMGTDWTYSYADFASLYTNFTPQVTVPYQVNSQLAYGSSDQSSSLGSFVPIPELAQKSADLTLLFLSFTGKYLQPIDDPWFSAHQQQEQDSKFSILTKQYTRDRSISSLGCTEQHKFCTSNGTCTPFLGYDQVQHVDSFNSALTPHQNVTFDRLISAVTASNIRAVVDSLARTNTPLLATNASATGSHVVSLALPDDQWQRELNYWHTIAMAQLQRTIVQWGTGQTVPERRPGDGLYLLPPQTKSDAWYCENVMIPSTVYQSFSVLAIALVIVFGTLVIIVSLTIETLAGWFQKRFRRGSAPLKIWDHDDMLRLHYHQEENVWCRPLPPPPPPKDYGYRPAFQNRGPTEMTELRKGSALPHGTSMVRDDNVDRKRRSSQALPPEHLIFPFPVYDNPPREPISQPLPTIRSERSRDSWVAISLNSYEAVMPEVEARNILDGRTTGDPTWTRPITRSGEPVVTGFRGLWL